MEEETGKDTIHAADKTRQHQGYHEAEVTFGGEADLHKHYRRCKKNPGHTQFIPIGDFKIEHLPPDYRDNLVLDYIRAEADLTCRLSVRYTSESRPKFHPEHPHLFYPFYQDRGYDWMRVGTGWVDCVRIKYKNWWGNCICEECRLPGTQTPKTKWAEVSINTACHVVFDSDEARHTECHLLYDESSTHISQCPSLTRLSVDEVDIKQDSCYMTYVTHDMDLADKLDKMCKHRNNLQDKVWEKYRSNKTVSCDSDPTSRLTVIVSHPHGLSKQVTVGEWTHKQILSPPTQKSITGYQLVETSYSYNTATCPGSSGAHVITLSSENRPWWCFRHPHSEGGDGNNNKSGVAAEYLPSSSVFREDKVPSCVSWFKLKDFGLFLDPPLAFPDYYKVSDDEECEDESPPKESNEEPKEDVSKKQNIRPGILREDENDDFSNTVSSGLDVALSSLRSFLTLLDKTDGVSDDEVDSNLYGKGRNMSESEDETPPKEKNQEPKGDVSKGEDSTETSTGGRTSNEADDSKSMGAATATGKATTSSDASKKKGKAAKSKKQKKKNFLMSDSDLDDDDDDVDHHNNDDDDGDVHCDHYDKDDEDKEDDKSCNLSDDVHHYVNDCNDVHHYINECNDVKCFNPTGNKVD